MVLLLGGQTISRPSAHAAGGVDLGEPDGVAPIDGRARGETRGADGRLGMRRPSEGGGGPVVIITDHRDWHEDRLSEALGRAGIVPVFASLRDVVVDLGARVPVIVPGCGGRLPSAVMVRSLGSGSFEAISLRLGVLEALEAAGVRVWNGAAAIRRCVDKAATSLSLVRAGLPMPRTLVTQSRTRALDFLVREVARGEAVVSKPLFGAQGRGLRLLTRPRDLPEPDEVDGVWYLQRYVPPADGVPRDIRVFVSAGRVVAGMSRRGVTWITNVHQGGTPEPLAVGEALARAALSAAEATGARFCGVDLVEDGQGGLLLLEVNSMPAWRGLQSVAGIDVGSVLVHDLLSGLGAGPSPHRPAPPRRDLADGVPVA
jgi:ribosomal protein S6--L-glutamate ligase